jgi:hypothetical protein
VLVHRGLSNFLFRKKKRLFLCDSLRKNKDQREKQ